MHNPGSSRPRLLFFQWDHAPNISRAAYLVDHMRQHVQCLECFFDVAVVNKDCDYGEVCDRIEPDLVLFECGYRTHGSRRPKISNTRSNKNVPRVALHNGDSWCDRRSGLLADLDEYDIEAFFTISVTAHSFLQCIADRMYIWPNAINPGIHRSYGEEKIRNIHLSGQANELYPWRTRIYKELGRHFDVSAAPRLSYDTRAATQLPRGEAYARQLNSSLIVPACGAFAGELVRKHLEIPGCMSCLVTEDTPALRQAGFVDMRNCVFADHRNVVDRLRLLLNDLELTATITKAGYDLVHEHHTIARRSQIYDWYKLRQECGSGERIIQQHPFAPLSLSAAPEAATKCLASTKHHQLPLAEAYEELWSGDVVNALALYDECLRTVSYLPEAKLGKAIAFMRMGRPDAAMALLVDLIETTLQHYEASTPDPIEWACLLVCLVCQGRLNEASACSRKYSGMRHRELRLARNLVATLAGRELLGRARGRARPSFHALPKLSTAQWKELISETLATCGRADLIAASRAFGLAHRSFYSNGDQRAKRTLTRAGAVPLHLLADGAMDVVGLAAARPRVPPLPEFRYFRRFAAQVARHCVGSPAVDKASASLAEIKNLVRNRGRSAYRECAGSPRIGVAAQRLPRLAEDR